MRFDYSRNQNGVAGEIKVRQTNRTSKKQKQKNGETEVN